MVSSGVDGGGGSRCSSCGSGVVGGGGSCSIGVGGGSGGSCSSSSLREFFLPSGYRLIVLRLWGLNRASGDRPGGPKNRLCVTSTVFHTYFGRGGQSYFRTSLKILSRF